MACSRYVFLEFRPWPAILAHSLVRIGFVTPLAQPLGQHVAVVFAIRQYVALKHAIASSFRKTPIASAPATPSSSGLSLTKVRFD